MLYKLIFLLLLLLAIFYVFSYSENNNVFTLKTLKDSKYSKKVIEGASNRQIRNLNNKTFELTNKIRDLESKMSNVKRRTNKALSISKASME